MISQVLVLMLLSGAAADRIVDSRRAYSTCVSGLVRTELAAKTDPAAFDAKLTSSCKTQETAFHSAVVTVDVAAGIKRAVAEENASSEINDFIGSAKERYRDDFAASNPQ